MNAESKICLKEVAIDDPHLLDVIQFSVGHPTDDKILEVITSYQNADNKLLGAFLGDKMIGIVGFLQTIEQITIRHISVLPVFRGQNVGTLLLGNLKEQYAGHRIIAETDEESVKFYLKSGFVCNSFHGKYGNLRYSCEFRQK